MKTFADINISEEGKLTDVNTLFDLEFDSSNSTFYVSKKKYHFEDSELKFDYHFTLTVLNLKEWTGEDEDEGRMGFELKIVPTVDSVSEKYKADVMQTCCVDEDEINMFDLSDYGTGVTVGYSEIENVSSWDDKKVEEELNFIATCIPFIEEKGEEYYFNQAWNQIGTTGWDSLRHEILDESLFRW